MRRPLVALVATVTLALAAPAVPAAAEGWSPSSRTTLEQQATVNPQIVVHPSGSATAAWVRATPTGNAQRPFAYSVQVATRTAGGTWGAPEQVTKDTSQPMSFPKLAADPTGAVSLLWREGPQGGEALSAAWRTPGGVWTSTTLSSCETSTLAHSLARGPGGHELAVWSCLDSTGSVFVQAARRSPGSGWGTPTRLSVPGARSTQPRAVVDATGASLAVWEESPGDPASSRIWSSHRTLTGSWSAPVAITAPGQATGAAAVLEPDGVVTVAWTQAQSAGSTVRSTRARIGDAWATPADVSPPGRYAFQAELVAGVDGLVTLAYRFVTSGEALTRLAASSRPAGGAWSTPVVVPDSYGYIAARLVSDDQGRVTAVWTDEANLPTIRIRSSQRDATGGWSPAETVAVADGPYVSTGVSAAGDVTALWTPADGQDLEVVTQVLDRTAPALSTVSVPASVTAGTPVSMSAVAIDTWSAVAVAWSFGDGSAAPGAATSHVFAAPGNYTVTVTGTDEVGNAVSQTRAVSVTPVVVPPSPPPPPALVKPALTKVRLKGTSVRFRVSADATVRVRAKRVKGGPAAVKRVSRRFDAGRGKIRLRKVGAGTWKVTVWATNQAGASRRVTKRLVVRAR